MFCTCPEDGASPVFAGMVLAKTLSPLNQVRCHNVPNYGQLPCQHRQFVVRIEVMLGGYFDTETGLTCSLCLGVRYPY